MFVVELDHVGLEDLYAAFWLLYTSSCETAQRARAAEVLRSIDDGECGYQAPAAPLEEVVPQ